MMRMLRPANDDMGGGESLDGVEGQRGITGAAAIDCVLIQFRERARCSPGRWQVVSVRQTGNDDVGEGGQGQGGARVVPHVHTPTDFIPS